MTKYWFYGFLCLLFSSLSNNVMSRQVTDSTGVILESPDKKLRIQFFQREDAAHHKTMYYHVFHNNREVIHESALDIQLDNHLSESAMALKIDRHARWCENLVVRKKTAWTKDTTWKPVYGERSTIHDHYNAVTIELVKDDNPDYVMQVELRAYNAGVAFRYFFPEHPKGSYYRVTAENTEFSLPEGTMAWYAGWAQAPYHLLPLQQWPDESERPLTLQLPGGKWACLAEAGLTDYSRTKFKLSKDKPNTILTAMHDPADLVSPVGTPWRVIMIADTPGQLVENNDIILNLNAPSRIADPKWIKPGKIMREMTLTMDGARAVIDFASAHGMQYLLFDWKWYGPAFTFTSDATKVVAPLDMPALVEYGKQKGIGIWLYVNQQALMAQQDSLFTVFHRWGIKGVKFGFVQVGSHRWTVWLQEAIRKAAENQIMVNVHDDYRPTGEQRTWPNLMTAEGIRGNEEMPDATHNTVLPFTRFISGAADYTLCYYDKRIKTTHAHQLALAAVYYSPIQTLFWYDKPAFSQNEPELEFWEKVPVNWDETRVLQGAPGEYVCTARRSGNDWYVGTITNNNARQVKVALDFLQPGKKYTACIYSDDAAVNTATHVRIDKRSVTSSAVLDVKLQPSGGQAIRITAIQ
ncbi:alpha-glucosidase [Chitinophaga sp. ysch24]|uniref:Alpha-glucosidase n=2 Tax=Chitinophaga tropicalis TaxID=2683588 RepID=A0A7K1U775_9BACT|nr:alpha-glucosidase [Chitinophaga tropicalis]